MAEGHAGHDLIEDPLIWCLHFKNLSALLPLYEAFDKTLLGSYENKQFSSFKLMSFLGFSHQGKRRSVPFLKDEIINYMESCFLVIFKPFSLIQESLQFVMKNPYTSILLNDQILFQLIFLHVKKKCEQCFNVFSCLDWTLLLFVWVLNVTPNYRKIAFWSYFCSLLGVRSLSGQFPARCLS